jgi:diadenosine tetraphosphatase ApaH/serine/threonine PP2A family protein phosphatase
MEIDSECAYLVNPGSVGQPRDGDPRAAYCLYDTDASMVTYFRAPYDVAEAQRKIRRAGLPDVLADRLTIGR